jgi:hypothetical protein
MDINTISRTDISSRPLDKLDVLLTFEEYILLTKHFCEHFVTRFIHVNKNVYH